MSLLSVDDYIELRSYIDEIKYTENEKEKHLLSLQLSDSWLVEKFAMGMLFRRPTKDDEELAGELLKCLEM